MQRSGGASHSGRTVACVVTGERSCTSPAEPTQRPLLAWGELPAEEHLGTKYLDTLLAALRPVTGTAQLVHGDLIGNVLFHTDLPPLVIDLSPYWRPPAFAAAVVSADALVFEGARFDVVQPLLADPDFPQHLLRALIFRAVTDHLARPHLRRPDADDPYRPALALAVSLAQASR